MVAVMLLSIIIKQLRITLFYFHIEVNFNPHFTKKTRSFFLTRLDRSQKYSLSLEKNQWLWSNAKQHSINSKFFSDDFFKQRMYLFFGDVYESTIESCKCCHVCYVIYAISPGMSDTQEQHSDRR